jgi:lipopolysaccharide heptosyltransferase I
MSNGGRPSSARRILVVRLGALGDIIHALPAVASLKHSFAEAHLTWAVEPRWAPLVEGNPYVDGLLLLDRSRAAALWGAWRELRVEPFDFAVDFQGLIKSALVARVARCRRIFGFAQAREPLAARFYSDRIEARSAHRVDRNLELAAGAGAAACLYSFPLPPGRAEGTLPPAFVLASPLSGWTAKQWPLEHYAALAARLRRETSLPLVLNGPASARAALAGVPDTLPHWSSIAGLIDATRRAAAVVGVDSGPLHLAAALGKPGVAIFGPTDPAINGPYGGSLTVLRSPRAITSYKRRSAIDASMREISPEAVWEALRPQLCGLSSPSLTRTR